MKITGATDIKQQKGITAYSEYGTAKGSLVGLSRPEKGCRVA